MADSLEMANFLENVEQFINDENRIVTYEFLSQSVGIHVNLAKNVLEKYFENLKKKKEQDSYQVVYSLGGYVGKNLIFRLVKDINLEKAKSKLEKIISLHIYSIKKGKLEKLGVLYNSNITEIKKSVQQCSSQAAIGCSAAKLKSPTELTSSNVTEVKKNIESVKPLPSTLNKDENSLKSTYLKTEEAENKTHDNVVTAKEKTSSKLTEKKGGKPAIAAFFATQQAIGRVNPVKEPAEKKVVEDPKKTASHKRLVRESSDDENENKDANTEDVKRTKRFKLTEEKEKPLKSQEAKTKKPLKKAKKSSKSSGKPQRKRIQQFSDSESNSDDEEDEDLILSSPEMPPPIPAPMSEDDEDVLNATVVEPINKRGRKLVAKTFIDKDGFVVTTKEYETCEEKDAQDNPSAPKENSAEVPKAETKPSSVKHPSPPSKTKQKSITSFFTRK